MFTVLENNCRRLGLTNTTPFRTALSDHSGVSEMRIPVREDGTLNHYEASLEPGAGSGGAEKTVRVETSILDEFCAHHGLNRIDFIKCDVEGRELEVLEGAKRTLLHQRPTLLLEVNSPLDAGGHGSHVLEKVRELGYDVHTVQGNELRPWRPGELCVNYVLRPR